MRNSIWVASDPFKSLGRQVAILPRVELDGADVRLLGDDARAIYRSPVLGVSAIVLIHLQIAPRRRGDVFRHFEPFWSELFPLGVPNFLLGSLLFFKPESIHQQKHQINTERLQMSI